MENFFLQEPASNHFGFDFDVDLKVYYIKILSIILSPNYLLRFGPTLGANAV